VSRLMAGDLDNGRLPTTIMSASSNNYTTICDIRNIVTTNG